MSKNKTLRQKIFTILVLLVMGSCPLHAAQASVVGWVFGSIGVAACCVAECAVINWLSDKPTSKKQRSEEEEPLIAEGNLINRGPGAIKAFDDDQEKISR